MNFAVIEKYSSAYPNPICFKVGDKVSVGLHDTEYIGWIKVTTNSGKQGWAPELYLNTVTVPAIALQDYIATELNTEIGQVLEVIVILNEWAWAKNPTGQLGWVPLKTITHM